MSIRIELRYAVLTALLVLLWLVIEYTIGLQDKYIAWHAYAAILAFGVPVVTYRLALQEKIEEKYGKLSFRQAFVTGLLITVFSTILSVPVQFAFHKLINPDFFETMILYCAQNGKASPEQAAFFFNLKSYVIETALITFVVGIIISLILAFRMRTIK